MMRRSMLLIAACIAAAAAGVTAATALTSARDDVPPQSPVPQADSDSIDATAPDPAGGPRWAVRAYRSASGGLCLQPGRYDGRAFGHLGAGGALEADPIDESGSCADLTREPMTAMLIASPARKGQPGRTVLIGATAPGVTDVAVTLPGGSIRHPVPGPRGTFVVPIAGFDPSPGFRVEATLPDGSRVRRDL